MSSPFVIVLLHVFSFAILAIAAGMGIASASLHLATGRIFGLRRSMEKLMIGSHGIALLIVAHELLLRYTTPKLVKCSGSEYYAYSSSQLGYLWLRPYGSPVLNS